MEITDLGASQLSALIAERKLSCREVMQAFLARIRKLNPTFNAIVNLAPDDVLLAQADAADKEIAAKASRGWLHGIPVAIKDAADAAGFPTPIGCELLAGNRPARPAVAAVGDRLEARRRSENAEGPAHRLARRSGRLSRHRARRDCIVPRCIAPSRVRRRGDRGTAARLRHRPAVGRLAHLAARH